MARILYGVAGEGMGHAIRSRVVIEHLARQHDVNVVVSGRAHDYLKARERDHLGVSRIWGLSIVYEDNEVQNFRTVLSNLRGAAGGWPRNVKAYFDLSEKFSPEVVISDFETWSSLYARTHGLPCISVDNNQIVNRCDHPPEVIAGHEGEFLVAKTVVKAKLLPGCFHYLIGTFFYPDVAKPRTTLHPPVLRPEILAARAERGDHLLVYQTSTSNEALPEVLRGSGLECRVYGLRRDLAADEREGNVVHRPFSEATFVEDLRTARAVVSGGSFTLMSEAVYLHKPMLAVPVRKQFEQVLNARYLERLGYGVAAEAITGDVLGGFVERLPELERGLARYAQDGNRDLLAKLDEVVAAALAERASSGPLGPPP